MADLTESDLEVVEASLAFALQNCPVEGILSTEDGTPVSLDDVEELLDKVRGMEATESLGSSLGEVDTRQLRAVIEYTSQNCPVENVSTFHDGRPITGKDIVVLAEKLKGAPAP